MILSSAEILSSIQSLFTYATMRGVLENEDSVLDLAHYQSVLENRCKEGKVQTHITDYFQPQSALSKAAAHPDHAYAIIVCRKGLLAVVMLNFVSPKQNIKGPDFY